MNKIRADLCLKDDDAFIQLIAPHHGSERTDNQKIIDNSSVIKKGIMAVICCSGEEDENRPNTDHLGKLDKRSFNVVYVTENLPVNKNSIRITI